MNFVYGDSYGGVQAAEQAADNSDRHLLMGLIAAQQAAQRMAADQQLAARKLMFDEAMAAQTQEADRAYRQELLGAKLAEAAMQDAYRRGQLLHDKDVLDFNKKKLRISDEPVERTGQSLAAEFNKAIQADAESKAALDAANARLQQLDLQSQRLLGKGAIAFDKDKGYTAKMPEYAGAAAALNKALTEADYTLTEKTEQRQKVEDLIESLRRRLWHSGFDPSPDGSGLVSSTTGKLFPFQMPVKNSPSVNPVYDPVSHRVIYPAKR